MVEAVKEKARERGEVPTSRDVLKRVKEKRQAQQREEQAADIEKMPAPLGEHDVIVIDPPWPYEKRTGDVTHRGRCPYPSMSIAEIAALELPAAENSIVWLWTTNAFTHEAYHVLEAWGCEPKTILTWIKDRMGLGDWLRGKTEHCIMAVKGKPLVRLTNQTTALHAPMREHSRKPDEFYQLVAELCPGSKCELFSREKREGWVNYGAERDVFE